MTIDPDFLQELDRFDAALDNRATALERGEQQTKELGEGLVFSDHRRYAPGDDTRLIDWNVYSRTDELYIRQFEAERNLTVHVLLDGSESMGFADRAKFERAAKIGLGYCHLFLREHNTFRFATFAETYDRLDSGASTAGELLAVIDRLNETETVGGTDVTAAISAYAETIDSRSLVVIGSDLLVDPDAFAAALESLAGHEVVVVQTVTPEEVSPPVDGETIFEGLETTARLRTYFSPRRKRRYQERLEDHCEQIELVTEKQGGTYVRVETDETFFDSFSRAWIG
ncbi:MAG: DUF58 domain-containing protein [Natronomonas sp.]